MKIVIVDDNLAMRKVLSTLFESNGHQVVAALADGSTLRECVERNLPDLVCLDYNLPGKNGLELLQELEALALDTDVVIVTASTDPELDGRAADGGAAGFLRKPFSQQQILEELQHIEEARRVCRTTAEKPAMPNSRGPGKRANSAVIVDDSGSVRLLLKGVLEGMGMTVVAMAATGQEGIAAARKHLPALVCLDVEMPQMSGLEALPLIREASPPSKVVMVTGNASKIFVETAIKGGAKGYILKPVRPAHVEAFVRKVLG